MNNVIIEPYDDELMIFDPILKQYQLTEKGIFQGLGVNLGDDLYTGASANPSMEAVRVIKKVSRIVYNYLYSGCMRPDQQELDLHYLSFMRPIVYQMLVAQMEYYLGKGDPAYIDSETIEKDKWNRRTGRVAQDVIELGDRIIPQLGRCLKYLGNFNSVVCYCGGRY